MCEKTEVTIIGGGPSGLYLASLLAKKGIEITVIEQHKTIGKPVQCAGLVTPRVFEQFNISSKGIIQNSISTANIHSPTDNVLTIGGNKIHAYSIDRAKFDQNLSEVAEQNGAKLITGEKAQSIQHVDSHIETCTNKRRNIHSSLIVGADGPKSTVRDIFCFSPPQKFLKGIGSTLTNTTLNPKCVELFIGNDVAPGFFAWIIPVNKEGTMARVGLCVPFEKTPKPYFDKFLRSSKTKSFIGDASIKEHMAGIIPLGALKQTVDDRVVLVGDAAAQVKPTSGGGIFTGISSAQIAAQTIIMAIQAQTYSKQFLSRYHTQWKKTIGRELSIGMKLHGLFTTFSDEQFEKYVTKFKESALTNTINEYGDIDYPSKLIKPMIKHTPSLLKLIPGFLHIRK
jgi:digeranylgeranylglycerophospholipid reductase